MKRLLVVRLSALGDVIHTIPAVMSLLDQFEVSWVVEKPYAELVQIVSGVDVIPVRLKMWSLNRILDACSAVRDEFDVAVDFQGLIKSALLARVSGARERYGFAKEAVREKPAAMFYNHQVNVDQTQHVVDWNRQLAAALPGNPATRQPDWSSFPRDPQQRLAKFTEKIVLLPGAGRPEKQWPVPCFRELVARYGGETVVVAGPGERTLAEGIGGLIAPETNLRELSYLLRHARLVVGGDTGPLHLADALGTKVVGLYGPTGSRRNGPYGQRAATIDGQSMESISAVEVMRKIDEVLAR